MLDTIGLPRGKEQSEKFRGFDRKTRVQYDYRDKDGELFSRVRNTLLECRKKRDQWLARRPPLTSSPVLEGKMSKSNDLQRFRIFFWDMGVRFQSREDWEDVVKGTKHVLTVAQAHFCFDAEGTYVGVKADETGLFYERRKEDDDPS